MTSHIQFEQHEGVATVTLCHPKKFNAMSRAMWRELKKVFVHIQSDASLRCVRVVGAGDHFCAGGDISEYTRFRFEEASLRAFHEDDVWGALSAMLACDVPMVAQISGNCMGAGVEIASCCDIRLAGASAKFGAPIAKLGFPMAPREAALVTRELGLMTARQMLLQAAVLDASQMAARGFLTQVVDDDDLAHHTHTTVLRQVGLAPQAARMNKQVLRALNPPLTHTTVALTAIKNEALEALVEGAYAYANSTEHREGITAFVAKRPAVF